MIEELPFVNVCSALSLAFMLTVDGFGASLRSSRLISVCPHLQGVSKYLSG